MKGNNLIGRTFGKLTVTARGNNTPRGKTTWICQCECGKVKEKAVVGYDLIKGKVRSCGCLYYESNKGINKTHGDSGTRLYSIWVGMRQRCNNENATGFKHYGEKGIAICESWNKYENFKAWAVKNGYSSNLTIDRIDNSKGYSPENCRWVTYKTQERNRTNNKLIEINGEKRTISEWSELSGVKSATIAWRINHGWKPIEYLIKPDYANKNRRKYDE